jgi:hypothetical protein
MRIVVRCPGSFTNGLNSPERGEGRWSQNYALMLSMAGHDVYAASMGDATGTDRGVKLIPEPDIANYGHFDVYIDSAWWRNKEYPRCAKKYINLKWALETYLIEDPLPEDHYIAYPYPSHQHYFDVDINPHRDKCFPLPTMFGTHFIPPNVSSKRVFYPGKVPLNRPYQKWIDRIIECTSRYEISGVASDDLLQTYNSQLEKQGNRFFTLVPYDQVISEMHRCRVNVPVLSPACVIEATFQGMASIFWKEGEFFPALANNLGINIANEDEPDKFETIFERLMTNDKFFREVVHASQDYFVGHRYDEALRYFNNFVEAVF